jgi:vacuolar-type H+-ATPase subunit I/STV1
MGHDQFNKPSDVAFGPTGEVVVASGEKGGKDALARLRKIAAAEIERVTEELKAREALEAQASEQSITELVLAMDETLRAEKEKLAGEAAGQKEELRKQRDEIESLKPQMTIGETEFRQLDEKYGSGARTGRIFWGGMGAEAVRTLIERMDLEEFSRALGPLAAR